jgi:hypothetical protein
VGDERGEGRPCCHKEADDSSMKSPAEHSSSTTYSTMDDMSWFVVPWNCASRTNAMTCSPVRSERLICMDRSCAHHDSSGGGVGHHSGCYKATSLEWLVVHSFLDVDPTTANRKGVFEGWTQWELTSMCLKTDDADYVSKHLFGTGPMAQRLMAYVKSYAGAAEVLDEKVNWKSSGLNVEEMVEKWSGGIDPCIYVLMMKSRLDKTNAILLRQKNTIEVWKGEAMKQKEKAETLSRRLWFTKKKGNNNK